MSLFIRPGLEIPMEEITFTFARSGGPGGQNVNKVSSKAILFWNPAESAIFSEQVEAIERMMDQHPSYFSKDRTIVISSQLTRDQIKNKMDCLKKLQMIILQSLQKPKNRIPTRPTRGSVRRRLEDKARNAQKKAGRQFRGE
ncbi:MAG: alternative ribosome rescue aminoacyl-tRNA hydrolase ArfB [Planctomycetia bacterium]|nr:alternative ribosome rescue aminoacyl-tRNA hydrolase ArfB [Planctomycetia bacterium]